MNSEDKMISCCAFALAIIISAGSFAAYFTKKEQENTKRTMYENWDKFSEVERTQLIKNLE